MVVIPLAGLQPAVNGDLLTLSEEPPASSRGDLGTAPGKPGLADVATIEATVGKQERSGDTMESVIEYCEDPSTLTPDQLRGGFFQGWPSPPSPELHLAHLRGAEVAVVALDQATGQVVGFVTAIGDGALTAFIPLLEVLPGYRGRGIGASLVRQVLARLRDRYSIDLVCDESLIPFYELFGGVRGSAVLWRNRDALVTKTRR